MVKMLAVLAEDLSLVSSTHIARSRRLTALFWPLQALHAHDAQAYMQAKITIHLKYNFNRFFLDYVYLRPRND